MLAMYEGQVRNRSAHDREEEELVEPDEEDEEAHEAYLHAVVGPCLLSTHIHFLDIAQSKVPKHPQWAAPFKKQG